MKAMILCAGLGTRLRPWTLEHPKALVPVKGIPMLRRVAERLYVQGFDEVVLNVHHFADQIIDYVAKGNLPQRCVKISDESESLLDTGGGILHAAPLLAGDKTGFLVHNVDILSNADLRMLYDKHLLNGWDVTLLVSDRKSSRKLVFHPDMLLKGWIDVSSGAKRPQHLQIYPEDRMLAFSGIYVVSWRAVEFMKKWAAGKMAFPVMDFLLSEESGVTIGAVAQDGLEIIDIGKPDSLSKADSI